MVRTSKDGFCFFKETPCIVIPIECVVSIGGDVILVTLDG